MGQGPVCGDGEAARVRGGALGHGAGLEARWDLAAWRRHGQRGAGCSFPSCRLMQRKTHRGGETRGGFRRSREVVARTGGRGWTGSWRRRRDPAVPGRIWRGTTARTCVGAPRGQWQLLLPEERREREIQRGNRERRRTRRKQRRDVAVLLVAGAVARTRQEARPRVPGCGRGRR